MVKPALKKSQAPEFEQVISEIEKKVERAKTTERPEAYLKAPIVAAKTKMPIIKEYAMPKEFEQSRKIVMAEFVGGIKEEAKKLGIKLS